LLKQQIDAYAFGVPAGILKFHSTSVLQTEVVASYFHPSTHL